MPEPINYFLEHSTATVDLTLTDGRLIAKTQGKGALDKPRIIDIPLSDLKNFCLVPTIATQNLVGYSSEGDHSYDSEFIFSYREGEKTKVKRTFVSSRDQSFTMLLDSLKRKCPDASLLHLAPAEAQKQIGAVSAGKVIYIFLGLIIGVPVLIALIIVIFKILRG